MRIGIVNDMGMAREVLRRVVQSCSEHEVAWTASDGAEAIALARADRPDLILMDLFMPGTDGVEATRRIMGESPCAILVVTATISGHLSKVYQAMGYGALDALDTPTFGPSGQIAGESLLLHKIDIIGKLLGNTPDRSGGTGRRALSAQGSRAREHAPVVERLVLLGASTGGPNALAQILAEIPPTLGLAIIIVQHVDAAFAPGLGQWLSDKSRRNVTIVTEGLRPAPGEVFLSGTNDHLILGEDRCLHYSADPIELSYRPSVDVFFASAAPKLAVAGVAALLTGMGKDGAAGLLDCAPTTGGRSPRTSPRVWSGACRKRPSSWGRPKRSCHFPVSPRRLCASCPSKINPAAAYFVFHVFFK